jgi:hypothetical protein
MFCRWAIPSSQHMEAGVPQELLKQHQNLRLVVDNKYHGGQRSMKVKRQMISYLVEKFIISARAGLGLTDDRTF